MNMRSFVIIGSILTAAIGAQLAGLAVRDLYRSRNALDLAVNGTTVNATITHKQSATPARPEKYARVHYKFRAGDGKMYKGRSWVNRDEYEALRGKFEIEILYDPARPLRHIVKFKLSRGQDQRDL